MQLGEDIGMNDFGIPVLQMLEPDLGAAPQLVYIDQQNSLGRFIPNLIMKSTLDSHEDSDGNTLLHHMCSFNSPYLSLYLRSLPDNDPQFNQQNKFGISPLDIAALYCSRETMESLKRKGSSVSVNGTDYWAIRGANLECWSGNIQVQRKELIHWAAYNDLPSVLRKFVQEGADVNLPDLNGLTPIDTALINKSYKSFQYLLSRGYDITKPQKLAQVDSPSMLLTYNKHRSTKKSLDLPPIVFVLTLLVFQLLQSQESSQLYLSTLTILLYLAIVICRNQPTANLHNPRVYSFYSRLFRRQIQYDRCHILYMLYLASSVGTNVAFVNSYSVGSYTGALLYWATFVVNLSTLVSLLIQVYGVVRNLTNQQMFSSQQCGYLYKPISVVVSKKLAVHKYNNPFDHGVAKNIKEYMGLS